MHNLTVNISLKRFKKYYLEPNEQNISRNYLTFYRVFEMAQKELGRQEEASYRPVIFGTRTLSIILGRIFMSGSATSPSEKSSEP